MNEKIAITKIQALFRGYQVRKKGIWHRLRERERKRRTAIHELVSTEKTYYDGLSVLYYAYFAPLMSNASGNRSSTASLFRLSERSNDILSKREAPIEYVQIPQHPMEQVQAVFQHIKPLLTVSKQLLSSLQKETECIETWSTSLGTLFPIHADAFEAFIPYCKDYQSSVEGLDAMQATYPKLWPLWLAQVRAAFPEHVSLPSLLVTPVQRLPRYILLLKEIQSYTPIEHPSYPTLSTAIRGLEQQTRTVDNEIDDAENISSIMKIREVVYGLSDRLLKPGRRYVDTGTLSVVRLHRRFHRDFQPVRYYLFTDLILMVEHIQFGVVDRLVHTKSIPLTHQTAIKEAVTEEMMACYVLSPRKTYTLSFSDKTSMSVFISKVSDQIKTQLWKHRPVVLGAARTSRGAHDTLSIAHISPIDVTIVQTSTSKETSKPYTLYHIQVKDHSVDTTYVTTHRFREFVSLFDALHNQFPQESFSPLPKRTIFGSMEPKTIQSRVVMLNRSLQELISKEAVRTCELVEAFLAPPEEEDDFFGKGTGAVTAKELTTALAQLRSVSTCPLPR